MKTSESFAERYGWMPDNSLQQLSLNLHALVPEARHALRKEMELRHLPVESVDWEAQPTPGKAGDFSETLGRFFRNLLIFVACNIVEAILIALLPNKNGIDIGNRVEILTTSLSKISFFLAILTSKFIVPKKLTTVWIVGILVPPCLLLFSWLIH